MAERGWALTGVDFSSDGVAKLAASPAVGTFHVDWVVANLRSFQPPPSTFDLVIQFFVRFPAEQRQALLQRAAAALPPEASSSPSATTSVISTRVLVVAPGTRRCLL